MAGATSGAAAPHAVHAGSAARWRTLLVAAEGTVVLALLLGWLLVDGVQESRSLWVLFLYSFPSEFLVGLVPHEPALIYFGTFYSPWVVASVAGLSTAMAEAMNYSVFSFFYDRPAIRSAYEHPAVRRTVGWFGRAPFTAIAFAAFTPVPFFPVRFLVVMTGYPVWKYLLGVIVARTPRFYILAAVGAFIDIPLSLMGALFLVMLLSVNLPAIVKLLWQARR